MGLSERLFARWYPALAQAAEDAGLREIRARLLEDARGRTLEIGAGNGFNVEHYSAAVTDLVLSDPSAHMLRPLQATLERRPPAVGRWEVVETGAEVLPFPDESFDTVVATFVFCSIPAPAVALGAVARVLRPGGRFLFLEHVRSPDSPGLARVQDAVAIPHRVIAAGCHPNRRTAELIENSSLTIQRLTRGHMPRGFPTVRPIIWGTATAPG